MAALVRSQVDEKTKAVDVMVKAAFMVCERFPRYKNTKEVIMHVLYPPIRDSGTRTPRRCSHRQPAVSTVVLRFNVSQCQEIRSQPDVDEPQRYATKPYEVAKEESSLSHAEKLETGEENVSCAFLMLPVHDSCGQPKDAMRAQGPVGRHSSACEACLHACQALFAT